MEGVLLTRHTVCTGGYKIEQVPCHKGGGLRPYHAGQHLPCFVPDGISSDEGWPYDWAVVSASGSARGIDAPSGVV